MAIHSRARSICARIAPIGSLRNHSRRNSERRRPGDSEEVRLCPTRACTGLGHNVNSLQEVDAVMEQAKRAGATIIKAAENTFWGGYTGYFQDPDGHLWEVPWNPEWERKDSGHLPSQYQGL